MNIVVTAYRAENYFMGESLPTRFTIFESYGLSAVLDGVPS